MLNVRKFTCENLSAGCVTDERNPSFAFSLESDRKGAALKLAQLSINDCSIKTKEQVSIRYEGKPLEPFTIYTAELTAFDDEDECARAEVSFETGRLGTPWQGKWISDGTYVFREKRVSPEPMCFRKCFGMTKKPVSARLYATAMGIYELELNGKKVGDRYFAPGFTSYKSRLQYQTYDVTELLGEQNILYAAVTGGWAAGSFGFTRKNRISADRQAFLMELRFTFEDGSTQVIGSDESFQVTREGNCRLADLYDGEVYDASIDMEKVSWHSASLEKLPSVPKPDAESGAPVRAHEVMVPRLLTETKQGLVYDFGQNFAGVVMLKLQGTAGQTVTVTHAELLNPDGTLNTAFLRTAKACLVYICRDGEQVYAPRFTYMGFRYICVSGIEADKFEVSAKALYSDMEITGEFTCSDQRINRLQSNILWSAKSNFMDIPTDCPQRDERMGWTGDIAVFAPTACYNFNMSRFLLKWLRDMSLEQRATGGIPNTIPSQGYGFPETMPVMAVDFWGDACVLVPWAEYQARGDVNLLKNCYPMMKKYVNACRFWAGLFSIGKHRYLWNTPSVLHFGDWVAPDVKKMSQWQKRSKWTATASLCNTSGLLAKIAFLLGEEADGKAYEELSKKAALSYRTVLAENGRMKEEFQTAYVLPLYFNMFEEPDNKEAAANLARLVEESKYRIGTGFPGTPYILFALTDNGYAEAAYRMLLGTDCPSWLYEIKMGATTVWERWDGLDENGVCPIGNDGTDLMISYNHYASGAVGDFLYRRIAGIESLEAGYKRFLIKPVLGGGILSAKGCVESPYGRIVSDWKIENKKFCIKAEVPVGTVCELKLPDGTTYQLSSGIHSYCCQYTGSVIQERSKKDK